MSSVRFTRATDALVKASLIAAGVAAVTAPGAAMAANGMPQLDINNPLTLSQIVWGAIIFFVLYLIFSRWGLPRVASVIEEREARINADLEAAREAKARADAAVAELTEATARARAEAQAAINKAVDEAKQEAAAQSAQLNAQLEAQLQAAEQRIEAARRAALGALRQVATDTASTVIGRLTGRAPDPAIVEGAVGAALAARGQG